MEEEQRLDNGGTAPIKIVAGNKCDLQAQRQVKAAEGLEWARSRRCGFMETSAREMVNIEETFALIVRRVVESRRRALGLLPAAPALGQGGSYSNLNATAMGRTAPLDPETEKPLTSIDMPRKEKRFWSKMKCW
jgi:GTPase KRas